MATHTHTHSSSLTSPSLFAMASTAATPILQGARTCSRCGRKQSPSRFVNRQYRHRLTAMCLACRQSCRPGSHAPVGAEPSSSATASSEIVVGRPTPLIAPDPTPAHEASSATAVTPASSSSVRSNIVVAPFRSYSTDPATPSLPPRIVPTGRRQRREQQFLPRGQDSQDPPEVAEARVERVALQRRNRVARRQGESPPPTPSLSSMVRHRGGGDDGGNDELSEVDRIGMISEARLRRY